jgi:hypothetical protein
VAVKTSAFEAGPAMAATGKSFEASAVERWIDTPVATASESGWLGVNPLSSVMTAALRHNEAVEKSWADTISKITAPSHAFLDLPTSNMAVASLGLAKYEAMQSLVTPRWMSEEIAKIVTSALPSTALAGVLKDLAAAPASLAMQSVLDSLPDYSAMSKSIASVAAMPALYSTIAEFNTSVLGVQALLDRAVVNPVPAWFAAIDVLGQKRIDALSEIAMRRPVRSVVSESADAVVQTIEASVQLVCESPMVEVATNRELRYAAFVLAWFQLVAWAPVETNLVAEATMISGCASLPILAWNGFKLLRRR